MATTLLPKSPGTLCLAARLTATSGAVQFVSSTISEAKIQAITPTLSGLQFGQVTVIVQDGRKRVIERTERRRMTPIDQCSSAQPVSRGQERGRKRLRGIASSSPLREW